ncbi:MAG: SDR family oxidoreductase [Phycisphaerales bacterium]
MIIGSGSASFEILRYLVERLPVMVTPSWVKTESQPVAIADVLHWLVRCLSVPDTAGKTLEIGGSDVLPYRELMRIMAEELGLRRRVIIPLPVLTPRLSSGWISLVTPVSYRIARPLADGLRNRVVVTSDLVQRLMPHSAMSTREAIHKALERVRTNAVDTRWSVAGPVPGDPDWAGGTVFADERSIIIAAQPEHVFQAVCRIGGGHGWYAGDLLWRIRGWMDTLVGGPGLRRGRRDPDRVEFGETLDFWRVVGLERGRTLSLLAEMKLPGVALLNFSMTPAASSGCTSLTMTARFRPKGILGILYWYSVLPLHNLVFGGMLRGIKREAERTDPVSADRPVSSKLRASRYGRARLWLGISAVGTMVVLAILALAIGLPSRASGLFAPSLGGQALLLVAFLVAYAAIHLPFDVLGGYILPRRFWRHHPPLITFLGRLLRGVVAHTFLLAFIGTGLLLAGQSLGVPGVIGVCALLSLALLATRLPLARMFSPLQQSTIDKMAEQSDPSQLPTDFLASDDEGFTGGIIGVLRPRRALLPERWLQELGQAGIAVVMRRRELAAQTGSWARGRLLALGFTLLGVMLTAFVVGPTRIGTGEGIITFSLVFTLWSFIGLLTLPTPSRAGVAEVDAGLRASGIDPALIDETIRKLDTLQDAEPERSVGVEAIFHPVPSVRSRLEGPMNRNPLGFLDAARTSVFLSAAGLGLLGRAVHCNCGRPALWVFLPSD